MKSLPYILLLCIAAALCASTATGGGRAALYADTDSASADTSVADTVPTDTVLPDTVIIDTVPPDTVITDTVPTDTVPTDTVPMGPGGVPVHPEWPYTMASRTIPLVHVTTDSLRPILDKVNYLPASMYIEVPDSQSRWQAFGSVEEPVELEIRGRGNHTWYNLPKKAYKLKFKKKQTVLGMPKHKHYALICYDPFYTSMWLAPYVGMEVSRLVQPGWVPRMEPVEVVLNGEYRGLYLLVETIKADPDRLDITLQEEESEDPATLSSGWLVELDNQYDDYQIEIPAQTSKGILRVTHKDPEVLSEMQREWLIGEFTHLNDLIERPGDFPYESWTEHFDVASIARYMVIREFLHDLDGYSGSQYFHRDLGSDKWVAGPMWDMEIWPDPKPDWICNYSRWSLLNWIPFMMKHPLLNDHFCREWDRFMTSGYPQIFEFIDTIVATYVEADLANTRRWPEEFSTLEEKAAQLRYNLRYNAEWIDARKMWDQITVGVTPPAATGDEAGAFPSLRRSGRRLVAENPSEPFTLEITTPDGRILLKRHCPAGTTRIDLRTLRRECGPGVAVARIIPPQSDSPGCVTRLIL